MDVRALPQSDVAATARVLTRAFMDDPGTVIFEPDPARRAEILPPFFESFIGASVAEDADVVVAGDPVQGVAMWFGPDRHGPSPDAMTAHGFGHVLERSGPAATQRLLELIGELEAQHARLAEGPHLRLQFFGVDPDVQGRGIGSSLIEHGHASADALRVPCYLDTFTKRNVEYYERRGYRTVAEFRVAGEPAYGMLRPAV